MFIPNNCRGTAGRVSTSTSSPTSVLGGIGFVSNSVCIDTAGAAATDSYAGGFRVTSVGKLACYDASLGLPAGAVVENGFAKTTDGLLCYDNAAVGSDVVYVQGLPVTNDGRLYIS